jgi:alpha-glucosidase
MNFNKMSILSGIAALGLLANVSGQDGARISSPDGKVQFKVFVQDARLRYTVTFRGQAVIETSPMALTVDETNFTEGVAIAKTERYRVNETYPWRGVHARATNHCEGAKISLKRGSNNPAYTLEIRAYNDGAAFRFVVPGENLQRVPDEATRFVVPNGSTAWYHDLNGHYEGVHTNKPITDVKLGEWAAPPLTFKLPGGAGYASITEAALVNYSGMALQADGQRSFHRALPPTG